MVVVVTRVVDLVVVAAEGGSASSPPGELVLVGPAVSSVEVEEQATGNKMLHKITSTIKQIKGDLTFLHFIFQLP